MKHLRKFFQKVFVAALLAASFGSLTAFGSYEPTESISGGNGASTTRHLKSITIHYDHGRSTTKTIVYDNFIYDAANRVTAFTETDPEGIVNYQYIYSTDKVICTSHHTSVDGNKWDYEEIATFLIENGLVTVELWDGSQMEYEYTDGLLSSIDDPGYQQATYERNDDGCLHSFTRNKKGKTPYTTTFSYGEQSYNGPLLLIGVSDPFCLEGTEYCWPLQLSGLFGDLLPGNLPETATKISDDNTSTTNFTFKLDSEGYITEFNALHSSTLSTIIYEWETGAGIYDIPETDPNAPAVYYNLNGIRVNGEALAPGLYIKRQGGSATKWHVN